VIIRIIILLFYFSISFLFCQTELIKRGSDGVIEIIDQRLLPENWFLSDTNNIKQLDQEKYNIFKSELYKMTADYKKEILTDFHKEMIWVTYSTGETYTIPGLEEEYIYRGYSKQEAYQLSHGTRTKDVQEGKNRIIDYNQQLWTKSVEWEKIVEYVGGYSELRKSGITKDKKSLFDIESELVSIELTSPNSCIANVKIKSDKKYGLKFHKVPKTEYKYKGTYSIDEIHYPEIFALSKSLKNEDDVKNLIPNIHFLFEDKEYMPKQKITIPLNKIDKDIVSAAVPYVMTMIQMIDDLIPHNYYIKMGHIQKALENSIKAKLKAIQEDKNKCATEFFDFREASINSINSFIYDYLQSKDSKTDFLSYRIKKFEKKTKQKAKKSISIKKYNREFLEYVIKKEWDIKNEKIISRALIKIDEIQTATNLKSLFSIITSMDWVGDRSTWNWPPTSIDMSDDWEKISWFLSHCSECDLLKDYMVDKELAVYLREGEFWFRKNQRTKKNDNFYKCLNGSNHTKTEYNAYLKRFPVAHEGTQIPKTITYGMVMEKLKQLLDKGYITEEQYEQEKESLDAEKERLDAER